MSDSGATQDQEAVSSPSDHDSNATVDISLPDVGKAINDAVNAGESEEEGYDEDEDEDEDDRRREDGMQRLALHLRDENIDPEISYSDFLDEYEDTCSVATDVFEDYWDNIWEHPRVLHTWLESSYVPGRKPIRYNLRLALDYDHCTSYELKRFVTDRHLQDPYPNGTTLKYFYIRVLEAADSEPEFPQIMDLPAEMRLEVYRYLLTFPTDVTWKTCYPSVLQACQQVHEEAKGILYDENVVSCEFCVAKLQQHWQCRKSARVHNVFSPHTDNPVRFYAPLAGRHHYPEFLRRISRLHLGIAYAVDEDYGGPIPTATIDLNHVLCTLASFLMDGHRLKEVNIELHISEEVPLHHMEHILYPLRRIRNVETVNITGCFSMPAHMKKALVKDITSSEPVFNTLKHWSLLNPEADAQRRLLEVTHLGACDDFCGDWDCLECSDHTCVSEIRGLQEVLYEDQDYAFMGSRQEESFIAQMSHLRNKVKKLETTVLLSHVKVILAKREKRTQYEAISDEGRFEEAENLVDGEDHPNIEDHSECDWPNSEDDSDVDDPEDFQERSGVDADPNGTKVAENDRDIKLSSDPATTTYLAEMAASRSLGAIASSKL